MQMVKLSRAGDVPAWVPESAQIYLTHVGAGRPMRAIAREMGVRPSTILRTIRRIEARRDDPLVDEALGDLSAAFEDPAMTHHSHVPLAASDRELRRVLRRMAEPGAILALADGMDRAIVVREGADVPTRLAVTSRDVARELALRDWIASVDEGGRLRRYHLTAPGRAALKRMLAEADASGSPHGAQHRDMADEPDPDDPHLRISRNLAESPLSVLGRRRDKDGRPFLAGELVAAGERLREDFELSQMGPRVAQNWDRFITGRGADGAGPSDPIRGPENARARVAAALADLGPGLGDVVLRTCCFLEGVETVEKRLGWSARSGKIVLRIALERLRRHYAELGERASMIG